MLDTFLFSPAVFILQVRCKLETSITNSSHKKVRFLPGVETVSISQKPSDQLYMFNVISGYWNSQSETASEINNQFESLKKMGEKLYE